MTTERHPDIEVYIKDSSIPAILKWLEHRSDHIERRETRGLIHELVAQIDAVNVPVMIQERAVGKAWISIWLNSSETPWNQDIDCAKEISQHLNVQTRCVVDGWQEGDEPDEWWKIDNGQQEKINWKTH